MAPRDAIYLTSPSKLSSRLSHVRRCAHRCFSISRNLQANARIVDPRPRSQRNIPSDLNAKYRGQMEEKDQPGSRRIRSVLSRQPNVSPALERIMGQAQLGQRSRSSLDSAFDDPHHLHVYSTRHNTHVTLTRPNRTPMLSLSAGNIGFKHAQRGSYDAAFQLASYSMSKMLEKGMVQEIKSLELVMRGFGPGREAFQKALLSSEGRILKPLVSRVTDATRLKFGGTRSKNVRRL